MRNTLILLFVFFIVPSKAQETSTEKDTEEIVNVVLASFDEPLCLVEETFYGHPRIAPDYMITHYFRVYSYSIMDRNDSIKNNNIGYRIFLKDVDGVITKEELEALRERNLKWEKEKWLPSEIRDAKNVVIEDNCQDQDKRRLKISEPIFTDDRKKALMLVSGAVNVFAKENNKWILKGGIATVTH